MLTQIDVQGFKSLHRVRVELGQVNVFVGANGSGKTNLLEAIGLLGAAADGQVDDQALLRRGVRLGTPSLYRSSFADLDNEQGITIEATWRTGQNTDEYQVRFEKLAVDRQQSWPAYRETMKHNGRVVWQRKLGATAYRPFGLRDDPSGDLLSVLTDYAVFSPNTPTLRGKVPDTAQRPPVGLAGGQLAEAIDEMLSEDKNRFGPLDLDELLNLLDWVDRIDIVPPSREIVSPSVPTLRLIVRFTDRWMRRGRNQLPAYAASEGALYVLFVLVLALHPHPKSPRLFAIDNFDQAMHPRLARATARLFCQQMLRSDPPRQALLTTHHPLVLDGLDLRDDRIRLFAVERGSRGETQVHRVRVSEDVLAATQEGLSLSNLWVMGRLGGVPDLL